MIVPMGTSTLLVVETSEGGGENPPLGIPFEVFQRAPLGNEMMGSYRTSSAVAMIPSTTKASAV